MTLRRWTVAVIASIVTLGIGHGVVSAHAGLGAASPAPGVVVGGTVDAVQLRYNSSVVDPEGSVTGPDGEVLSATVEQDSALAVAIVLDTPLTEPGVYEVRHVSTSVDDGDRVDATYRFEYDPTAPPPVLELIPDDGGLSLVVWIVLGVGLVVIVVLAWRLVTSARRVHSARTSG